MEAAVFKNNELFIDENYPKPLRKAGEALIKVSICGVCNTDKEIMKGYMGFNGILGHEFVGIVEEADNKQLIGKRVVGEINLGCGHCEYCAKGLERHCPTRDTFGILRKDGCFAQYVTLPEANLLEVPADVTDREAVFTEPLAAALEILEQLHIEPSFKVAVLGDGKLGILCALALSASNIDVVLIGKHPEKLAIAGNQGVETALVTEIKDSATFDVVVEATGSISGFETSLNLVKPRGTLVLKSTIASSKELNLAPVVINEITVLGSRCGRFAPALRLLRSGKINVNPLISGVYKLKDAKKAFEANNAKDTIKILLEI